MQTSTKTPPPSKVRFENALAKQALENIVKIEKEAQEKKLGELASLQTAKTTILDRISELKHQLGQIDSAITAITGRPALIVEKRPRRNWAEDRERVSRWLRGRRGEKFAANDLVREFPELDGQPVSIFLKPLVEAGTLKTDTSEGIRRTKYFVEA